MSSVAPLRFHFKVAKSSETKRCRCNSTVGHSTVNIGHSSIDNFGRNFSLFTRVDILAARHCHLLTIWSPFGHHSVTSLVTSFSLLMSTVATTEMTSLSTDLDRLNQAGNQNVSMPIVKRSNPSGKPQIDSLRRLALGTATNSSTCAWNIHRERHRRRHLAAVACKINPMDRWLLLAPSID